MGAPKQFHQRISFSFITSFQRQLVREYTMSRKSKNIVETKTVLIQK